MNISNNETRSLRRATHAGSWYSSKEQKLNEDMNKWLQNAKYEGPARVIIAPHAGYDYSGATAAVAYKQIKPEEIKTVFILGPSHYTHFMGCALSQYTSVETPFHNLDIDSDINQELYDTGHFEYATPSADETEHSLEMHFPYIAKVFQKNESVKIVPILVGQLSNAKVNVYANILLPYFRNPSSLFVISSDFCHWGKRYNYTFFDQSCGEIWQSIENLDRMGMALIENLDIESFEKYLKKYKNTICGRYPILIMITTMSLYNKSEGNSKINLKFISYAQSGKCRRFDDYSVSYTAACAHNEPST